MSKPSAVSHRWRESDPRFFCTTRTARPVGASRSSHFSNMVCSSVLPTLMGGLLQIRSKRTDSSTSSGALTSRLVISRWRALTAVSCRARSFTSIAITRASGRRRDKARAIGPAPQPRSRNTPSRGGSGASVSKNLVPVSRRPCENTPRSLRKSKASSGRTTVTRRGSDGVAGEWSK